MVESILPQVLVLRCIPICASAAWIRYSPRLEFCYFDYFSGTARCRPVR